MSELWKMATLTWQKRRRTALNNFSGTGGRKGRLSSPAGSSTMGKIGNMLEDIGNREAMAGGNLLLDSGRLVFMCSLNCLWDSRRLLLVWQIFILVWFRRNRTCNISTRLSTRHHHKLLYFTLKKLYSRYYWPHATMQSLPPEHKPHGRHFYRLVSSGDTPQAKRSTAIYPFRFLAGQMELIVVARFFSVSRTQQAEISSNFAT